MITWGINSLNHGSSIAIFEKNKLVHWQFFTEDEIPKDSLDYFEYKYSPSHIYWYEQPWKKKTRQAYAGQWNRVFNLDDIPRLWLKRNKINVPITYTPHHGSHAAAGYYTSPFNHCAIVVLDAIGEWETMSIWEGKHGEITKLWSDRYPRSLGLFYSAFTDLIHLTPIKEEYKLQQLSEQGDRNRYLSEVLERYNKNLHKGVTDWPYDVNPEDHKDIAAAVQFVFEIEVDSIMRKAKDLTKSNCLVYMGGCAMNSKYNQQLKNHWDYVWSLPMPGDPSSAIGAVLYHTKNKEWDYKWNPVKHLEIKT
jgi:carbamoyltransferase